MKITITDLNDAHEIVKIAESYKNYDFDCVCGRYTIDLKSIMGVLSLGLPKNVDIIARSLDDDHIESDDAVYEKFTKWSNKYGENKWQK